MTLINKWQTTCYLLVTITLCMVAGDPNPDEKLEKEVDRKGKLLPIFQVVRFPNDACTGTSLNGTCYTAEECSNKGGTNQGSCASGFGVCCSFTLSCGGSSSENNTYITQASTTSFSTNPCNHKICPCSTSICRIRYDFATLTIATQATCTVQATTAAAPSVACGQCVTDAFTIGNAGAPGSPTICGTNSGYHMILDTNGVDCQNANFAIDTSTTTSTRAWTIRVTQYSCAELDASGPPGCLQYYTQTAGMIQNFGWPTSQTTTTSAIGSTTTHLANQYYQICIRRGDDYCYICYDRYNAPAPNPEGFGLSLATTTSADAAVDTRCTTDYIELFGAQTAAIAAITGVPAISANTISNLNCGRYFTFDDAATSSQATLCSKIKPFKIGVNFDATEICTSAATNGCEWDAAIASPADPSGSAGFKLQYWQVAC